MESTQAWWLGCVFGVLPLLLWLLRSWNELKFVTPLTNPTGSAKLPPGNMGLPVIGELLTFLWYFKIVRRPDDFIKSKREKYGDGVGLYRTHLFGSPSIIGCSPAFNKYVFQSHDLFPLQWPSIELIGHNALAAATGKRHTRIRNFVSNAINKPDVLKKITKLVQPNIVASLQSWADRGQVKAMDEVKKIMFENIGNIFVSFQPGPMLDMIDNYFAGLMKGLRATPSKIPGTAYYHAFQCRKKLMEVFGKELENRKQSSHRRSEENFDLMEGLTRMRDEEGSLLCDEEVLENIVSLVMAGYDTTSVMSVWALYFLAKSPDVLQKLREENIASSKRGDFITYEELAQLKYTNKVVEEIIRMANIVPFVFRVVKEDVIYQGYKIPKDWRILLWIRHIHTDPENFDDPMNFNPERWNEPAKAGTYQVFGGGIRICAGNMLARTQIAIFIHHLVTVYKWELINPDAKIDYLPHSKPVDGLEIAFRTM